MGRVSELPDGRVIDRLPRNSRNPFFSYVFGTQAYKIFILAFGVLLRTYCFVPYLLLALDAK